VAGSSSRCFVCGNDVDERGTRQRFPSAARFARPLTEPLPVCQNSDPRKRRHTIEAQNQELRFTAPSLGKKLEMTMRRVRWTAERGLRDSGSASGSTSFRRKSGRVIAPLSTPQLSQEGTVASCFDQHRGTSDTESTDDRPMHFQFARKPVLEPAIGMFEEDQFQSLVAALSRFPIIRRIQVEPGHCFRWAPHIHDVSLEGSGVVVRSRSATPFCSEAGQINEAPSRCFCELSTSISTSPTAAVWLSSHS
jgi:hypothetical protein